MGPRLEGQPHASEHAVDVGRHVRIYLTVFVALAALTLITVTVSHWHLSTPLAVAVALLIATIKGSMVACYFMHLISERKLILLVLALTVLFFFMLLLVPVATDREMQLHVP